MDDPNELLRSLSLTQTLEKLQAQFNDIDQTGTSFMDFNYDALDQETIRRIENSREKLHEKREPLAMEMGRGNQILLYIWSKAEWT